MNTMKLDRRSRVLVRLEAQLKSGVKTEKKSFKKIPLTESNVKRINREIIALKKV